ncbi:MAG TPA: D-alanine--D-alanine ligase [Verrucomicrobiae bacterium]|nr:D-alanine--D-alanine ligase [Verrucomicrobiae bacterium]
MKQLKIAVLMGGPSAEREVSLRSGTAVANALAAGGARVVPMDIRDATFTIPADVDVAFLALHGTFGEDGSLQRILDDRGIVYTGSGPEASARAFDKIAAKQAFVAAGVPTPAYEVFEVGQLPRSRVARLGFPLVVKPSRQGSSVGISIVEQGDGLDAACELAGRYDPRLLAEQFVSGRELTIGILDGRALPVVEIRPKKGFYNYQAKYTKGATEYLAPASLDRNIESQAKAMALRAHDCLGCRDYSRVDLMLSAVGELFVLEVNTIPGFTETSLLPKAARAAGIEFPELCARLVQLALARNGHNGGRGGNGKKAVTISR